MGTKNVASPDFPKNSAEDCRKKVNENAIKSSWSVTNVLLKSWYETLRQIQGKQLTLWKSDITVNAPVAD